MTSQNEHKRVKHRDQPGDVSKRVKIKMREISSKFDEDIVVSQCQVITVSAAKIYCKMIKDRGRKVQRQRDKDKIEEELST